MKQITISLLCVCVFTLSAVAQYTPAADNTKKNERDRSAETKTSGDQANSPEDVQITATIRRAGQGSFTLCHREEREDYYYRWNGHAARPREERGGENKSC